MTKTEALEIAGAIWCDPRVSHKTVDPELATVFAEVLMKKVNEARRSSGKKPNYWEPEE